MAIVIRESNDVNTSIKHLKGFIFETILAPNYFLNDLNEIELFNSNIY